MLSDVHPNPPGTRWERCIAMMEELSAHGQAWTVIGMGTYDECDGIVSQYKKRYKRRSFVIERQRVEVLEAWER
jgi:hypothetical protein